MRLRIRLLKVSLWFLPIAWVIGLCPSLVFSQADFYKDSSIRMIAGTSAGGTGDIRSRVVVTYLRKYIPGNPTIIIEYMPGGGGRKAANFMFRNARPDGLTIGSLSSAILTHAVLGQTGVQYEINRFIYLGATNSTNHSVFITDQRIGLGSVAKLQAHSGLRIGAQEVGHTSYNNSRLFAWILGLKEPKFVTGYSGPEVDAAIIRREVDARSLAAASLLRRSAHLVEKKEVFDIQAIIQIPKGGKIPPLLAHVPELESFAKRDIERKTLALQRSLQGVGSPYVLPPGTPKERASILQEAFRKVFSDPNFLREYEKSVVEDPAPLMPEELDKMARELSRDPEVIGVFKQLSGAEPLPR